MKHLIHKARISEERRLLDVRMSELRKIQDKQAAKEEAEVRSLFEIEAKEKEMVEKRAALARMSEEERIRVRNLFNI